MKCSDAKDADGKYCKMCIPQSGGRRVIKETLMCSVRLSRVELGPSVEPQCLRRSGSPRMFQP